MRELPFLFREFVKIERSVKPAIHSPFVNSILIRFRM